MRPVFGLELFGGQFGRGFRNRPAQQSFRLVRNEVLGRRQPVFLDRLRRDRLAPLRRRGHHGLVQLFGGGPGQGFGGEPAVQGQPAPIGCDFGLRVAPGFRERPPVLGPQRLLLRAQSAARRLLRRGDPSLQPLVLGGEFLRGQFGGRHAVAGAAQRVPQRLEQTARGLRRETVRHLPPPIGLQFLPGGGHVLFGPALVRHDRGHLLRVGGRPGVDDFRRPLQDGLAALGEQIHRLFRHVGQGDRFPVLAGHRVVAQFLKPQSHFVAIHCVRQFARLQHPLSFQRPPAAVFPGLGVEGQIGDYGVGVQEHVRDLPLRVHRVYRVHRVHFHLSRHRSRHFRSPGHYHHLRDPQSLGFDYSVSYHVRRT